MSWIKPERFKVFIESDTAAFALMIMMIYLFCVLMFIQEIFIEAKQDKIRVTRILTSSSIALIETALSEFNADSHTF